MVISIKNHLKDGVDLDCFNILNLIYRTIGPLEESWNKQEIELLRLMQSIKAFYFDYSNEMNTNYFTNFFMFLLIYAKLAVH